MRVRMGLSAALVALCALAAGCTSKNTEPLKALAPQPLPALTGPAGAGDGGEDREAAYRLTPAPVFGPEVPRAARRLRLDGTAKPDLAGVKEGTVVLLVPEADVYLAQEVELLAALDHAGAEVWLAHPEGKVAFKVGLFDEKAFQAWLDEAKPGKVRVIQRQDGFELQTNVGKLPGADPNGPTVPLRGGQLDVATLRRGFVRLKDRFSTTTDVCFVPSFGTELAKVASAMTAVYGDDGKVVFEELRLVYPRPGAPRPDAGKWR